METLKDYLVKITAHTEGIAEATAKLNKLSWTLAKTILGVKGIMTVVMAAAKAINKNVKESIKLNDSLESTAKKLKKTTEQARAHEIALSVMGKTYQEIKKSKSLKAVYDDMMALNKAFGFQEAPKGTIAIKDLKNELNKVKFVAKLGFSQFYEAFRTYCAKPLEQFRGWIREFNEKLNAGLGEFARKMGLIAAKVVKELLYQIKHIVDVAAQLWDWGTRILKWWSTMPEAAKKAGAAIVAVIAMIQGKIKPLHMLLTAIYILIDDFIVWSRGGKSFLGNAWQNVIDLVETLKSFMSGDFGKIATAGGLAVLLFGGNGGLQSALSFISTPLVEIAGTVGLIYGIIKLANWYKDSTDQELGQKTAELAKPVIRAVETGLGRLGITSGAHTISDALDNEHVQEMLGKKLRSNMEATLDIFRGKKVSDTYAAKLAKGETSWGSSGVQDYGSGTEIAPGVFVYQIGGSGGNPYQSYTNSTLSGVNAPSEKNVTVNTQANINVSTSNAMSAAQQVSQGLASIIAQNVESALA